MGKFVYQDKIIKGAMQKKIAALGQNTVHILDVLHHFLQLLKSLFRKKLSGKMVL